MAWRITLGLLLAAVVSWGLHAMLWRAAEAPAPVGHFVEPEWVGPLPAAVPRGGAQRILLVGARPGRATEHPADHAPIVRILEGGTMQVLRAAPLPDGPTAAGTRWRTAVVELPGRGPFDLGAVERARLLELLRAWGAGSAPETRLSPPVDRLLRWLR